MPFDRSANVAYAEMANANIICEACMAFYVIQILCRSEITWYRSFKSYRIDLRRHRKDGINVLST